MSELSGLNSSMLQELGGNASAIKDLISKTLEKKMKIQKNVYETQLRNVKTLAMAEALEYVKEQSQSIAQYLTKEHRKLVERFQDYKIRTEERIK